MFVQPLAGVRPAYDRLEHFYRDAYAEAIQEVRPAGRTGAVMLHTMQGAGDWSDAATGDLCIGLPLELHAPARIDVGGGQFRVERSLPNAFVMTPPQFASRIFVEGPHALHILAIPYRALKQLAGDDAGLPKDGNFGRLHSGFHESAEIRRLLTLLWTECGSDAPGRELWADGALLQLSALLLRQRDGLDRRHRGGLSGFQMRRVLELLEERIATEVSLAELAAAVGLSPFHFSRAFRISFGRAPLQWLTDRRMERAQGLLANSRQGLTEIAQSVGYTSQSAFGAAFKRVTGLTPSEYRASL